MMNLSASLTPKSLGEQIRAQRQSLSPSDVGLPDGDWRRSNHLRIDEVAVLSGVSVAWLRRLEQNQLELRDYEGLQRVLNTLHFGRNERLHLLRLAGWTPQGLSNIPEAQLQATLKKIVDGMGYPACVLNSVWQPMAYNRAAAKLFTHWLGKRARSSNLLDYLLLDPQSRLFIADWQHASETLIVAFLGRLAVYGESEAEKEFIRQLAEKSPLFKRFAKQRRSASMAQDAMYFGFHTPEGLRHYQCLSLATTMKSDWRLWLWLER